MWTFATRIRCKRVLEKARPDWIVLAAAYTNVDDCESHPDLALAVNRDGAVNVAQAAKRIGAKLLFISSDYVFDGKKTSPYEAGDARNPQSVYGRSKAEAEVRLLDSACRNAASRGLRGCLGRVGSVFPIRF